MTDIATARAYAAELDALLAATDDDAIEDRLVFGVGELLGGLSTRGFLADIDSAMDAAAERAVEDMPNRGFVPACWDHPAEWADGAETLMDEAAHAVAVAWLRDARDLMAQPVAPQRSAYDVIRVTRADLERVA